MSESLDCPYNTPLTMIALSLISSSLIYYLISLIIERRYGIASTKVHIFLGQLILTLLKSAHTEDNTLHTLILTTEDSSRRVTLRLDRKIYNELLSNDGTPRTVNVEILFTNKEEEDRVEI